MRVWYPGSRIAISALNLRTFFEPHDSQDIAQPKKQPILYGQKHYVNTLNKRGILQVATVPGRAVGKPDILVIGTLFLRYAIEVQDEMNHPSHYHEKENAERGPHGMGIEMLIRREVRVHRQLERGVQ